MTRYFPIAAFMLVAAIGLTACSKGDPKLFNLRKSGTGPDEFSVLPTKEIEIPRDLASLPTPTLGGTNRVDPTPRADAIAALGGNAADRSPTRYPSSDNAIVTSASRYGITTNIRGVLASEDLEFRKDNRGKVLERLFGVTVYYSAYKDVSLDTYGELARLRRAGIRTPAAPPQGAE
jgi:hypothetical protein